MELQISRGCPSCGAPLEMREDDRLTDCAFCDVQSYLVDPGLRRYLLPLAKRAGRDETATIYFPYLRFKGTVFSCQGRQVNHKILDTTCRGLDEPLVPASLGVRPQAMRVGVVDNSCAGRFIRRAETAAAILQRAALLAGAGGRREAEPLYHRAFIGETVSCIYLPLAMREDQLYDEVLNRPLGTIADWSVDMNGSVRFQPQWQPAFLATICPQCGAVMSGERDSLVIHCHNCQSSWSEKGGKFVPVPYRVVGGGDGDALYLPFWRIGVETTGIEMRTMADLLAVTNQPVVINSDHRARGLEFWVPAFKVRPTALLKLARSATLSQMKYPDGEKKLTRPLYPVTLPLKEAIQLLKSLVAEMTVRKQELLPQLPQLNVAVRQTSLVFLPFTSTGHDLVQVHSSLAVASSIVHYGRKL